MNRLGEVALIRWGLRDFELGGGDKIKENTSGIILWRMEDGK